MGSTEKPPMRVWLSWSSGKDCAYSLHTLRQQPGIEVVGLLTTLNEQFDRVAMHAVRSQLLRAQADAAGLPVHQVMLPFPCTNEDYEQRMTAAIEAARAAQVDAVAFGDLFLQDVRAYREKMMASTNIGTLFPLWTLDSGKTTAELAREMLTAGMKAVLTCIDPKKLPVSFAGRQWDEQLLAELPEGVDPCGENGEFHTFVYDGPMFTAPVDMKVGKVVERDGFVFCDILPADYDDALAAAEAEAAASSSQKHHQKDDGGVSAADQLCPPPSQS